MDVCSFQMAASVNIKLTIAIMIHLWSKNVYNLIALGYGKFY